MSVGRKHRQARQAERVRAVFDEHPGGVSKGMLVTLAGVPETSIPAIMCRLRADALEIERTVVCLKLGGEWVYGWAESLEQHRLEAYKRAKNEARSLHLTVTTLAESVREHPKADDLRRRLHSTKQRLETVELEMEELTGQLRLIRQEREAA